MVEERTHLVAVAAQALDETFGVRVLEGRSDEFVKAFHLQTMPA